MDNQETLEWREEEITSPLPCQPRSRGPFVATTALVSELIEKDRNQVWEKPVLQSSQCLLARRDIREKEREAARLRFERGTLGFRKGEESRGERA